MKRHDSLVPLSQDHHRALILAQLIKKNAPAYNNMPETLEEKRHYAIDFYYSSLVIHFKMEEDIVYPLVKKQNKKIDDVFEKLILEHQEIENKVRLLDKVKEEKLIEALDDLGCFLEKHIRKEERKLFGMIQKQIPEKILSKIRKKIEKIRDK